MEKVTILGSTGSIGAQALEVVKSCPALFSLYGVSAFQNEEKLCSLIEKERPEKAVFTRPISKRFPGTELTFGEEALCALASDPKTDILVLAVSGIAALKPLLAALKAGKKVAIANKESLVCGGALVDKAIAEGKGTLIPVDSEQSAIFQCLKNGAPSEVSKLILTASGGPYWQKPREALKSVTPESAVQHPTWRMGRKISLDSATLFNKGLEVLEAARLFHKSAGEIEVIIHPESVVHSLVEYRDGTLIADLSSPDMRLPIQYAMTYPTRRESLAKPLKLYELSSLHFYKPDFARFPALAMAYDCLRAGGGYPTVYNGANEAAAQLFFAGKISFLAIEDCVKTALNAYSGGKADTIEEILQADAFARRAAESFVKEEKRRV